MASEESVGLRELLKNEIAPAFDGTPIEVQRQTLEAMAAEAVLPEGTEVEQVTVAGVPGEWVKGPGAAADKVLYYLHGGAYVIGSPNTHRELVARLSQATGLRALVLDYRLAPDHPHPAAVEDAVAAYEWLLDNGYEADNIVIAGDSAGGGLTLATLLSLRDAGKPLPAAAVLLSPWTDLTGSGESIKTRADVDPWIKETELDPMAQHYAAGQDLKSPLISPVFADLSGLPPMLIHVGDHEILLSDATRLAENAEAAGVDAELEVWDEMWHVFHFFAGALPEGREAIDKIGSYVRERVG